MSTIIIDSYGCLWAYGDNLYGQLGLGNNNNYHKYEKIANDSCFTSVSCGDCHSFALDQEGNLWSTGENTHGMLGFGDHINRNVFTKIKSDNVFVKVCCDVDNTFALDINGYIWMCGCLGTASFTKIECSETFVSISSGNGHLSALDSNGSIWSMGANNHNELGFNDGLYRNHLEKINTNVKFKQITCGLQNMYALDENGNIWGCGSSGYDTSFFGFAQKTQGIEFIQISAGYFHVIALDVFGRIWGFGGGFHGQLCENRLGLTEFVKLEPNDEKNFVSISCGRHHTVAIDNNGNLWGFGQNSAFGPKTDDKNKIRPVDFQNVALLMDFNVIYKNKIKSAVS